MNVESAFCDVASSMSSFVARGVTVFVAALYADTIVVSENDVTTSMLDARMFKMLSTASAPICAERSSGISGAATMATSAATTPRSDSRLARNQSLCVSCRSSHCHRGIMDVRACLTVTLVACNSQIHTV
jgi:hypothetical protein